MEPACSTENVQVDTESSQVIADCLGLPEILRKIFEYIPNNDLLNLSLVNKFWNFEARSVLNARGALTAKIKRPQDLRALASDLRQMNVVRLTGMSIDLAPMLSGHKHCGLKWSSAELAPIYEDILRLLPWKKLSVRYSESWAKCQKCPGFAIVRKIFENYCSVLEEFSLLLPNGRESFIQHVVLGCRFSRLKTLKLLDRRNTEAESYTKLIKALVSRAPNLQVLYTQERVDLMENLLEGTSAVHVTDSMYTYPALYEIPDSILGRLRMQGTEFRQFGRDFSWKRFNQIAPILLQSSLTTLSCLYLEAIFLVPVARYGICLRNVRKLWIQLGIGFHVQERNARMWELVKSFNFTRMFPNVSTVSVRLGRKQDQPLEFYNLFEQDNGGFVEAIKDPSMNINSLNLSSYCDTFPENSLFEQLVEMFPNIKRLSIRAEEIPLVCLWDSWLDLEELEVTLMERLGIQFPDSVFCGIFPEEAAELQKKDEEYLKCVNIVPIKPSIACLKGLKTFKLYYEKSIYHPKYMMSKVTGLIAFQRCPTLAVTVVVESECVLKEWNHMKPYASVVLGSPT